MADDDDGGRGGALRRLPAPLLRPLLLAAAGAILAVTGCARDDDAAAPPRDPVMSVAEAAVATGDVAVEGYLLLVLVPEDPPRLCRGLTDRVPPTCVEPSLRIEGLSGDLPHLESTSDGTHLWSREPVVARGIANGAGRLRLSGEPWAPAR